MYFPVYSVFYKNNLHARETRAQTKDGEDLKAAENRSDFTSKSKDLDKAWKNLDSGPAL